jgi:hypothetical protein
MDITSKVRMRWWTAEYFFSFVSLMRYPRVSAVVSTTRIEVMHAQVPGRVRRLVLHLLS